MAEIEIENTELTRGHKRYDSKVKNLEGIFAKLQNVLDISEYEREFQQIKIDVFNDSSISNDSFQEVQMSDMQLDYEHFALMPYMNKLDDLLKRVEIELNPFYELHLLTTRLDIKISKISWDNIDEIIKNAKELIDAINSLNTHDIKEKKILIDKAYKTVYSAIMHEEIFDRSDVLAYVNYLKNPANRENLGRLLENDLKNINRIDLIEEDLRTIKTEGLGYDYLNSDFVRKVSRKTVGEQNSEYQERKRKAIEDISSKVKAFSDKKNSLTSELKDNKSTIRIFSFKRSLLITKVLLFFAIPVIAFNVGKMIGKNASDKITEYKTITRTIDLNTGKLIGEPSEIFDEKETTYVATVMECSPWRKNPAGVGYIRNVTAYEYIVPEDAPEDYHVTAEDLIGNTLEKYKYVESKNSLDNGDSTTDSTVMITETYQDKNDTQKSTKYILPFSIVGAGIGIAIDVALVLLGIYGLSKTIDMFEELNDEIRTYKLSNQEIKDKLKKMKEDAIPLQEEYNEVVRNFGSWGDELIIPEIDSSWITQSGMKRTRKK